MARKKKILFLILVMLTVVLMSSCKEKGKSYNGELTKITLNEVAHSIFYAPMYVAIENGYFKEEGIDLKLVTGFGADKTMTAVISGEAQIGFMGSEASIYVYNEGASDYIVNFAQLTQRAGNFLVARDTSVENFNWQQVKGKTLLGGRKGGMPQMILEYVLKKNGINPEKDLTIIQNIDFGHTAESFIGGQGDFTMEFEPAALSLEQKGEGKVVASLGVDSGMVPYTAFSAKKSYIEENKDVIQRFVNAIQKGLEYVNSHSDEEIAKVIKSQFAETEIDGVVSIVNRYKSQNTWKEDSIFTEDSFMLLQNILEEAGELKSRVPYEAIVDCSFSTKASEK